MSEIHSIGKRTGLTFGPRGGQCVIVEGRKIPHLTGREENGEIWLTVDERMTIPIPPELAEQVAWFVANAMAVASGYSHLGAESKDRPFARQVQQI